MPYFFHDKDVIIYDKIVSHSSTYIPLFWQLCLHFLAFRAFFTLSQFVAFLTPTLSKNLNAAPIPIFWRLDYCYFIVLCPN